VRLYFPESKGQIDHVGYNNAIRLFRKALNDYIVDDPTQADYRVYCNLPWHNRPARLMRAGLPLLVYTMYESTRVPDAWRDWLNKYAAYVLVPSEFCFEMFRRCGVTRPMGILSLGVDTDEIPYLPAEPRPERYVFAWQGVVLEAGGRKNGGAVVRAFRELRKVEALGPDCRLVLKTKVVEGAGGPIANGMEDPSGVVYFNDTFTRDEMYELYSKVDCCVNPTRGEGFGLIPLEQMAMGKPVIATNWSMPYLDPRVCLPVKYKLERSPINWNHRHLRVSRQSVTVTTGGLAKGWYLWPRQMQLRPDGKSTFSVMAPGSEAPKIHPLAWAWNAIARAQNAIGLNRGDAKRWHTLYQENPGQDAAIDVDDMKAKMVWCYRNREAAFDLGFMAREYVITMWGLHRMREEFQALCPELERRAKDVRSIQSKA
jgi:hypothetical protein